MSNYNVTPITEIRHPYLESVDAIISTEFRRHEWYLRDVLANGYQSCIEIENLETKSIDYRKGICVGTSGSFAKVKMNTLKRFPEIPMTGICTITELINMIKRIRPDYDVSGFSSLEDPCQLTRRQQEELRRELDITAYLGGIRVPFIRYTSSAELGEQKEHYEGRITFSALSGEGDLTMCCIIMREMQEALQKSESGVSYNFDLSQLEASQTMHFILKMFGAERTPSK